MLLIALCGYVYQRTISLPVDVNKVFTSQKVKIIQLSPERQTVHHKDQEA